MENIECILCNVDNTNLLVRKNSYNIVRCNRCGLIYLNPRLDEVELAGLYNLTDESSVERITIGQRDKGHDSYKIKKFKTSIQLLKKHKKNIQNVFDFGCATGIFLELVAKEGWTSFGSDVSRSLVEQNRKRYGDHVKLQEGSSINFPDQYFDVVTLFDVVEHLPSPISTLKEVSRVLKDDGLIVISTPDIKGLFPRLTYVLLGKTIGAWEHPTPPGHVFQFSKETLRKTLKKADFELVDSRNFGIHIPYTVGQLENSIINVLRKYNHNVKSGFVQYQVANNPFSPPCEGGKSGVITKSDRNPLDIRRLPKNHSQETQQNETSKCKNNHGSLNPFYLLNKLPRLLIRLSSFGLVASIYPLARLLRMEDSMVVIAKKKA